MTGSLCKRYCRSSARMLSSHKQSRTMLQPHSILLRASFAWTIQLTSQLLRVVSLPYLFATCQVLITNRTPLLPHLPYGSSHSRREPHWAWRTKTITMSCLSKDDQSLQGYRHHTTAFKEGYGDAATEKGRLPSYFRCSKSPVRHVCI